MSILFTLFPYCAILIKGDDTMKNYRRRVQYYETDKMAIVYHANYIKWYEEARVYIMENMGYSYKAMEDMGIMMPVLAVTAQYKKGAQYGDFVDIEVNITKFNGIKMCFAYTMTDAATGELRMLGTSEHCFVDNEFRPVNIKKKFPEFYKDMMEYMENRN